jgi:Mg-chelatase subunit ChlD
VPSAIRVTMTRERAPLFFARLMGYNDFDVTRSAIASYQPRDIMLVLDCSASMSDDSEFMHMSQLGRSYIESNLQTIYSELGSPRYGNMQFTPQYIYSTNYYTVRNTLGLRYVPYPYPEGSWSDYFYYVQNDYDVYYAGYRKRYGYMTLINYWLERWPGAYETPDLWKTSEQPMKALKDAVWLFMQYLRVSDEDQVGLTVYTSSYGTAKVEHHLTRDFDALEDTVEHLQAGHYDRYTNIGDGIRYGLADLVATARRGTLKLLVVVTDGKANMPTYTDPTSYALAQADVAANANVPVVTISLGADADKTLMAEIADRTRGVHFNVPGGQTVEEYSEDLTDIFRVIALYRPLRLVQ